MGVTAGIAAKNQGGNKLCVTVSATIGGGLSSFCSFSATETPAAAITDAAATTTTADAATIGGGLSSLPCSAHSVKTVSAAAVTTTAADAAITTAADAAADRE